MKFIFQIERNLRVALFVALLTIVAIISSIYCFFINFMEVPLGFALGGVIVSCLYLLGHFMYKLDVKNGAVKYSIMMVGIRNIILITSIILLALMYYRWGIKLFNVFAFIGIYTGGVIIYVVDHLVVKNK